jgi:glycosyltransferase involved in cell wall biosynthesis
MRVAVNSAIDLRGISGTARSVAVIRQSLHRLGNVDVTDVSPTRVPDRGKLRNAFDQAAWDFWSASRACRAADVLISPCNMGAARPRQGHVLVVHDTMALDVAELFDPGYRTFFRALVGLSVRRSNVVLVPSQYTASRISARWPGAHIVVAPWPLRAPLVERSRDRPIGERRVLMVGVTEPYKNHLVGIDAIAQARQLTGEDLKLTLVGPPGRAEAAVVAAMDRADPKREWLERRVSATDQELDDLYARAWVLIQPSVLEGFGFPVAEAAGLGLPVVHSGRGALSEIVDAGVTEPDDPASYVRRLHALMDEGVYSAEVERHAEVRSRLSADAFDTKIRQALDEATVRRSAGAHRAT